MSAAPSPKVSKGPSFPLIWVVPVVALAIAAWMSLKEYRDRGPLVTIAFRDGSGVESNKTTLE